MQPFQEFRLWLRRGPASERIVTGIAAVLLLALLVTLLVPSDDEGVEEVASFGGGTAAAPGTSGTPEAGGVAPTGEAAPGADPSAPEVADAGVTPEGVSGTPSGAPGPSAVASPGGAPAPGPTPAAVATAGGASGCQSPPGQAKGISDKEIKIVVALTQIAAGPVGNAVFGVPAPEEAKADYETVIVGINKEGGIACRKVVGTYVTANPADEASMVALCRTIAEMDVFAVMDTGALSVSSTVLACFGARKIPFLSASSVYEDVRQQFFPYLYGFLTTEQLYRSTVPGLKGAGFFDPAKGFKKLGFIFRNCNPKSVAVLREGIRSAVPDSQVVTYDLGCPAALASPADIQQAVFKFQREGVTHVTASAFAGDLPAFTNTAEQQRFRPKYGLPDEAIIAVADGASQPNADNIANALAVTLGRAAEEKTPGLTPTAGTVKCNTYYKAAGQPPVYQQPVNAGHACNHLWMLQAGLSRAPQLSAPGMQAGLRATKSIDFSYPQGPSDFSGNGVTTAGQFYRVAQYVPGKKWQVAQKEFVRGPA